MDAGTEVKKKRSWAFRIVKWTLIGVALLAVMVLGAATIQWKYREHAQRATAALPVREQNLAIFDAAVTLLKEHYYRPELFDTEEWHRKESEWRAKAAASGPSSFLYLNVLGGFGSQLSSHVNFTAPPLQRPDDARKQEHAEPDAYDKLGKIVDGGPGFDMATVRRGETVTQIVGDVLRDSAAERAGISPGAYLPAGSYVFNGATREVRFKAMLVPLSVDEALATERTGIPPGSIAAGSLDAYLQAHGIAIEYAIPRPIAARAPFEVRRLGSGITYLRFDNFNDARVTDPALEAIDKAGPGGMVLDLRSNGGGMRLTMERVLGKLLGDDVTIGTLVGHGERERMHSRLSGTAYQGPLVVLIGPSSVSAAELVAAAIQDHKRGKLVGRMTSGSVLSSQQYPLPDGGTMWIPVSDFLRADERHIEGVGVAPDIRVLPTLADVRAGRDPALEKALQLLGH